MQYDNSFHLDRLVAIIYISITLERDSNYYTLLSHGMTSENESSEAEGKRSHKCAGETCSFLRRY